MFMKYEEIVAMLIREYGLQSDQIYKIGQGFDTKAIIKKIGMDQIEESLVQRGWDFDLELLFSHIYSGKAYTGVKAIGKGYGENGEPVRITTTAGANPDNCLFPNYLEVAEKRARHRLILRIAKLSKLNVHSEAESKSFVPEDVGQKKADAVVSEAINWTDAKVAPFSKSKADKDIQKLVKELQEMEKENEKKEKSVGEAQSDEGRAVDSKPTNRGKSRKSGKQPVKAVRDTKVRVAKE